MRDGGLPFDGGVGVTFTESPLDVGTSPVTLRLIVGRDVSPRALWFMSNVGDSKLDPESFLRAFSCLICTVRKWESSSPHLISSRTSLDREDKVAAELLRAREINIPGITKKAAYGLGAMCRKPAELTAFSRLRRATNAVLCGKSMSRP